MITVRPIHNDDDLALAFEHYEEAYYPMPPSDPVASIKFMMEQKGLTQTKYG